MFAAEEMAIIVATTFLIICRGLIIVSLFRFSVVIYMG